jgi:NADPH2:quinone reductase
MLAAYYEKVGAAREVLRVGEQPIEAPAPGDLTVRLMASGINPSDVKKRADVRRAMAGPYVIPHSDGAGIVTSVGRGVDEDWVSQRVWVCEAQHGRALGTAAEFVNVPQSMVHPLPDNTDFKQGAAIPIPMMTAHRCLTSAGAINGKTVLVTGAAGRVGYYAVQMASQMGARVLATVGSDDDASLTLAAGAQAVVNFRKQDYSEELADIVADAKIDLVVDVEFGNNQSDYIDLMNNNSAIAVYSSSLQANPAISIYHYILRNVFIHPILVYSMPDAAKALAKKDINRFLESGSIQHNISHCMPLENIAEAHELIESGCRGSVVLQLREQL